MGRRAGPRAAYCATAELRSPEQAGRRHPSYALRGLSRGEASVSIMMTSGDDLKVVEAIRKAVGSRIEIMIDANQAGIEPGLTAHRIWGFQRTLAVARELEQLDVIWLEEPLPDTTTLDLPGCATGSIGSRSPAARTITACTNSSC